MSAFEEDYQEDLLPRIRDLIDGYTKDSILKEFLQNADDSGATKLIVTYDNRQHKSLSDSPFEDAKGPALIIQNNSLFQPKDFKSIVKISAQGKAEDPSSTGRFGQGFSSTFSISDHPSFISNGRAYWFDVQHTAVAKEKNKSIIGWEEKYFSEVQNWINTFSYGQGSSLAPTTFRLPVRNERTAESSKISNEIFSVEDFYQWCDEWQKSAENLLFLRHIHKLILQEILEDGTVVTHVDITTKNDKEIEQKNNTIQSQFKSSPLDSCNHWLESDANLPMFKYYHYFSIKYFDRDEQEVLQNDEKWAVTNGLFEGDEKILITQAIKALKIQPNPRKVMPWAGVAIKLDEDNKPLPINGKIFTFLPLPIDSNYRVHIHGWFDLNPKRTEITFDGSGQDKDILIAWNQLLLEHAIGPAWAGLLEFIKQEKYVNEYYKFWLNPKRGDFDEHLKSGFYKSIMFTEPFYCLTKSNSEWLNHLDHLNLLEKSSEEMLEPFKQHFNIVCPRPPEFVINNFNHEYTRLTTLTPEFIREFVENETDDIEFPIDFGHSNLDMLNTYHWFESVLKFCAESDGDYAQLDDLPFELTANDKLYKIGARTLFSAEPNYELLKDSKDYIVKPELVKSIDSYYSLPDSWLPDNFSNTLTLLDSLIDVSWLDKDWLKLLVKYINEQSATDISNNIDEIKSLNIFKLNDGTITPINNSLLLPAIIVKPEDISNFDILAETTLPLISKEYSEIYRPLIKHGIIEELTSKNLAIFLINEATQEDLDNKTIRDLILEILTDDISWLDSIENSPNDKKSLRRLPLVETENGTVYRLADSSNIYLSSDFQSPKHITSLSGDYEIAQTLNENHRSLLLNLGLEQQSAENYIKNIIIPFIENTSNTLDRDKALIWLSNEWALIEHIINEDEKVRILDNLSHSRIIPTSDNSELKLAAEFYHPTFWPTLPIYFQNKAFNAFNVPGDKSKWNNLLAKLGAQFTLIPEHIISTIDEIIEDNDQSRSIKLLNFLGRQFEHIESLKYGNKDLLTILSEKPWFPVAKPSGLLNPKTSYQHLDSPKNLILENDKKIAGGKHYVIHSAINFGNKGETYEISPKEMANSFGLLTHLPDESVFESFLVLTSLKSDTKRSEDKIIDLAKAFYKYLGRSSIENIPNHIKQRSIRLKGNWVSAMVTFKRKITLSGTYNWKNIVGDGDDTNLALGLEKLGVKEKPSSSYLIHRLTHLPKKEPLTSTNLKDAKTMLSQLQKGIDSSDCYSSFPLLSTKDKLMDIDDIYLDDLASYHSASNKNDQLPLSIKTIAPLAQLKGVESLTENVQARLNEKDTTLSESMSSSASAIIDNLKSESFKAAILRLNYHEEKIEDNEINEELLNDILPADMIFTDKLFVTFHTDKYWIYTDECATTFEDKENNRLYVLTQEDTEDLCESISKYIADRTDLSRDSFSIIQRILRNSYFDKEIAKFLDHKHIKRLPETIALENDDTQENDQHEDEQDTSFITDIDEKSITPFINKQQKPNPPISDEPTSLSSTTNDVQEDNDKTQDEIEIDQEKAENIIKVDEEKQKQDTAQTNKPAIKERETLSLKRKPNLEQQQQNIEPTKSTNQRTTPVNKNAPTSTKNVRDIVSQNSRYPVNVAAKSTSNTRESKVTEIGDLGEKLIIANADALLLDKNNTLELMPKNNEGYDIVEKCADKIVRYIEVKTLSGPWRDGGVSVTRPQVVYADQTPNWWLFVIENFNSGPTTVYQLENPVVKMNSFNFDSSWKKTSSNNMTLEKLKID